jgi:hypothetical protein
MALTEQRPKAMAKITAKMVASLDRLIELRWLSGGGGDVFMERS